MSHLPLILPVNRTLAIIMGGGAGTRLFPLTKERAKPAVPLGGKYRLVDIPISNCLNSDIRRIYVLTQFNSTSLHQHIANTYQFDNFTPSFVEVLAAQQTPEGPHWYQGTADALRKNLRYFLERPVDYFIILSGDLLYRMDYRHILIEHLETSADLTVGTIPVDRTTAMGWGIMHTDEKRRIVEFVENPKDLRVLNSLRIPANLLQDIGQRADANLYQASIGIHLFKREVFQECLASDFADFGKNIIPAAINRYKVQAYIFEGYWEEIGTIRAFFKANLNLGDPDPKFNFNEPGAPIYAHPRFLPASIVRSSQIDRSVIADGCTIEKSTAVARILLGVLGAGVLIVFFAPSGWLALVGFAMMGVGTSVIFPLAMSAAAQLTDRPAPAKVASLAQVSFVAFLLGPPLLGYIAEYFGIRWFVWHRTTTGHPEHRLRRGAGNQTAEARG